MKRNRLLAEVERLKVERQKVLATRMRDRDDIIERDAVDPAPAARQRTSVNFAICLDSKAVTRTSGPHADGPAGPRWLIVPRGAYKPAIDAFKCIFTRR